MHLWRSASRSLSNSFLSSLPLLWLFQGKLFNSFLTSDLNRSLNPLYLSNCFFFLRTHPFVFSILRFDESEDSLSEEENKTWGEKYRLQCKRRRWSLRDVTIILSVVREKRRGSIGENNLQNIHAIESLLEAVPVALTLRVMCMCLSFCFQKLPSLHVLLPQTPISFLSLYVKGMKRWGADARVRHKEQERKKKKSKMTVRRGCTCWSSLSFLSPSSPETEGPSPQDSLSVLLGLEGERTLFFMSTLSLLSSSFVENLRRSLCVTDTLFRSLSKLFSVKGSVFSLSSPSVSWREWQPFVLFFQDTRKFSSPPPPSSLLHPLNGFSLEASFTCGIKERRILWSDSPFSS